MVTKVAKVVFLVFGAFAILFGLVHPSISFGTSFRSCALITLAADSRR